MAKRRVKIPSRPGGRKKNNNNQKNLMRQMAQLQEQLEEAQSQLDEQEFTGTAGGGVVEATVKGTQELTAIKIDPDVVDEDDIEMLEDLIISAVSEAQRKAQEAQSSQTESLTGGLPKELGLDGLNIPGF